MSPRYLNSQNAAISLKPIHFINKLKLILYPPPEFFITGIAIVNTTTNNHNRAVVPASKALVSPNNHVMTNNQQNYPQLDYSQQQQQALPPPASHHLVRYSFSSVCFKILLFWEGHKICDEMFKLFLTLLKDRAFEILVFYHGVENSLRNEQTRKNNSLFSLWLFGRDFGILKTVGPKK